MTRLNFSTKKQVTVILKQIMSLSKSILLFQSIFQNGCLFVFFKKMFESQSHHHGTFGFVLFCLNCIFILVFLEKKGLICVAKQILHEKLYVAYWGRICKIHTESQKSPKVNKIFLVFLVHPLQEKKVS